MHPMPQRLGGHPTSRSGKSSVVVLIVVVVVDVEVLLDDSVNSIISVEEVVERDVMGIVDVSVKFTMS